MYAKKRFWLALVVAGGGLMWFFKGAPNPKPETSPAETTKTDDSVTVAKGLFDLIVPGAHQGDLKPNEVVQSAEAAEIFQAVMGEGLDGTGLSNFAPGAGPNPENTASSTGRSEDQGEGDLMHRVRLQNKLTHLSFESPALLNDAIKAAAEVRESTIADPEINKLLIAAATRCAQEQGSTPDGQRFLVEVFNAFLDQRKRDPQAQANAAEIIRVVQDEALAKQMRDTWAERFNEARVPASEER